MSENEICIVGVKYVAITSEDLCGMECDDCALRCMADECEKAKCRPIERAGGDNVIFVEVQDERAKR